jgi:pimeloyl-ACP methyl ester carboxylesterase
VKALFVHGMGRSPLSGWPMLRRLSAAGVRTDTFGYFVSAESFDAIRDRLAGRLVRLAAGGDYVLIGHSLGGVLLRAALAVTPAGLRPPRRLFLLGSPVSHTRVAERLRANALFRTITRDCGALLGSAERMAAVGACAAPVTSIAGTRGMGWSHRYFDGAPNDGIVAVAETRADWITDCTEIPVIHTFLPSSRHTSVIVLDRIGPFLR